MGVLTGGELLLGFGLGLALVVFFVVAHIAFYDGTAAEWWANKPPRSERGGD